MLRLSKMQETSSTPPTAIPEVNTPKNNNFLVILLSILLLISCLIAGFFAYQTQKLVKELTNTHPSPTAISSAEPTVDETSNWKDYKFNLINLELKAPNDFTVESNELDNSSSFTAYIQNQPFNTGVLDDSYQLYIFWQKLQPITEKEFNLVKDELNPESVESTTIGGKPAIKGQIKGERNRFATYIFSNGSKISFLTSQPTEKNKNITDQILSTIKFTESTTVACTMEAKLCPDGSAVGRSGPNCEFAACPTPKAGNVSSSPKP